MRFIGGEAADQMWRITVDVPGVPGALGFREDAS